MTFSMAFHMLAWSFVFPSRTWSLLWNCRMCKYSVTHDSINLICVACFGFAWKSVFVDCVFPVPLSSCSYRRGSWRIVSMIGLSSTVQLFSPRFLCLMSNRYVFHAILADSGEFMHIRDRSMRHSPVPLQLVQVVTIPVSGGKCELCWCFFPYLEELFLRMAQVELGSNPWILVNTASEPSPSLANGASAHPVVAQPRPGAGSGAAALQAQTQTSAPVRRRRKKRRQSLRNQVSYRCNVCTWFTPFSSS